MNNLMNFVPASPHESSDEFVMDKRYLAAQAKSAVGLFLSPLLGVYLAMTGRLPLIEVAVRRKPD